MDRRLIALFALIIASGVVLRLVTLRFGTFMEPDVYAYYSVAQQTIANNLTITSQLSGFPLHNPYNEMPGLVYMAIFFSWVTGNLAASMLLLPVVFAFFEMIIVYMLAQKLSGNRYMALLAMLLFALMPGAAYKNVAGEWRGESFVPLFLGAALLLLMYAYERRDGRLYALSVVPLALSVWTWKGGIYAIAVVAVLAILYLVYMWRRSLVHVLAAGSLLSLVGFLAFAHAGSTGIYTVTTALDTIAELQPPTATFLVIQFGLAIGLAPVGALLYALKDRYKTRGNDWDTAFAFIALFSLFAVTMALQMNALRYMTLVAMPISIFAAYSVFVFYTEPQKRRIWTGLLLVLVIAVAALLAGAQAPSWSPGTVNQQFMDALAWVHNNTAANATFLTNWPDGSLVEGVAQRQSYSDSVFGIGAAWRQFPDFLFARQGNLSYLSHIKPDYVLVRRYWVGEAGAMALEGNLSEDSTLNGTNFMALENGTPLQNLTLVYRNNDTLIYRYLHGGGG